MMDSEIAGSFDAASGGGASLDSGAEVTIAPGSCIDNIYLSSRYRYNRSSYFTEASFISLSRDHIGLQSGLLWRF